MSADGNMVRVAVAAVRSERHNDLRADAPYEANHVLHDQLSVDTSNATVGKAPEVQLCDTERLACSLQFALPEIRYLGRRPRCIARLSSAGTVESDHPAASCVEGKRAPHNARLVVRVRKQNTQSSRSRH